MSFLSYWDIFGFVLITIYFFLSWLYPKRAQEKPKGKAKKEGYSSSYEKEDLKEARGTYGVSSEGFIDRQSDVLDVVSGTSRNSPFSDAQQEFSLQEVSTSSSKSDSSSENNAEKSHLSSFVSETDVSQSEKAIASSEWVQSKQDDAGHASNTLNDELLSDTSSKFPELVISPENISLSLSEIPKEEDSGIVSNVGDLDSDDKDVSKPVQFEEVPSNSCMECKKNLEDGVEGLPADVRTTDLGSDFSDNLKISPRESDAPREIQTTAITSHTEEEISREVTAEDMDSINLQLESSEMPSSSSSVQKPDHLEKFADDLASNTIETAVDNSICLNTFAESLSEKIFSDSADDVISEVQAGLEKQKKEEKIQKHLEMEELESLGTCVASEVVNEAVGEAALKKEYMDDEEPDMTSAQEIKPHIGFVVENVVNSAICEAASKLKRDQIEEATAPNSENYPESETPGLSYKSNENETNNNVEAVQECDSLQDVEPLKDEANKVVAEAESELPFELSKPLSVEPLSKDVAETADKPVEEKQTEELDESYGKQNIEELAEVVDENVSEPSAKTFEESAKTEVNKETTEEAETDEETPVNGIPRLHGLIDTEKTDETTISGSIDELNEKPELEQYVFPVSDLDNAFKTPNDEGDKLIEEEDKSSLIPQIRLTSDKDNTVLNNESEKETSPPSSPELATQNQITLRNKDQKNGNDKEGFWRKSLILDLEEDLEFEDSFSSEPFDVTSPDLSKERREITAHLDEDSEDFTDSEEDEIIDHDAEAKLGAVGGSAKDDTDQFQDDEFDFYDYEQDFDDEDNIKGFEPVFTVDGLCVSRQQKKEKPKLKSVGSHYNRAVVLDNGCGIIKLGYAGDRVPRVIEQNVAGMPQRFSMHITGMDSDLKDYKKYGSEAVAKAGVMHLTHPMKAGLIESWTDIEDIWEHLLYEELGVEVGDNPVLITEVSQNSKRNREKIAEILFEHLNVPAMYLADQLPLSMYASGMTSGVCLSSGYSCTQAGVVYEGHTLTYTLQQLDIGGGDLTENLKILLRDVRARNFTTSSGWQIVNDIKEKLAFVAKDYDHDIDNYRKNDSLTQYYKLPDGQMVDIGYECMSCVEPLFQPDTLMSADSTTASQPPVHKLIDSAIKRCDPDLQDLCYKHIVLSGGTTLLNGFTSRLQHELHHINHRIRKIRTPEHRRYSPWIGGSILASLSSFDEQYVTVDDYGESGSQVVHMKCF